MTPELDIDLDQPKVGRNSRVVHAERPRKNPAPATAVFTPRAGAKLAMRKPAYSGRMPSGSQRWLLLDDIRLFAVLSYKPPHRCEIRVLSLARSGSSCCRKCALLNAQSWQKRSLSQQGTH